MALVQLTLAEIDLIGTFVLQGDEAPYHAAFDAATASFYGAADFDASDTASMSRVVIVDLPAAALSTLAGRLYDVAADMDARARKAGVATDHSSAERLHRGAGQLRASAVQIARSA